MCVTVRGWLSQLLSFLKSLVVGHVGYKKIDEIRTPGEISEQEVFPLSDPSTVGEPVVQPDKTPSRTSASVCSDRTPTKEDASAERASEEAQFDRDLKKSYSATASAVFNQANSAAELRSSNLSTAVVHSDMAIGVAPEEELTNNFSRDSTQGTPCAPHATPVVSNEVPKSPPEEGEALTEEPVVVPESLILSTASEEQVPVPAEEQPEAAAVEDQPKKEAEIKKKVSEKFFAMHEKLQNIPLSPQIGRGGQPVIPSLRRTRTSIQKKPAELEETSEESGNTPLLGQIMRSRARPRKARLPSRFFSKIYTSSETNSSSSTAAYSPEDNDSAVPNGSHKGHETDIETTSGRTESGSDQNTLLNKSTDGSANNTHMDEAVIPET